MNTELGKQGKGGISITAQSEENSERRGIGDVVTTARKYYAIQASGEVMLPSIHYTYADGYMVAGPSKDLVASAIHARNSGRRLDTSGNFRRLLPTDQHANFSGFVYQNAREALKLLATVAPEDQEKMREIAEKIGPTLIAAYADAERIQVTTFGSSMDMLMQTALSPAFHRDRNATVKKHGTTKQMAAYR
jgi:hypothetical protein